MVGRLRLVLFAASLFGLFALVQPGRNVVVAPTPIAAEIETPIVAIRGQPLAEHEEPLPEGARVRIGSTRFRHTVDLGESGIQLAGDYVVTTRGQSITLTDRKTGRRVWTEQLKNVGERYGFVSFATSADGRRLVVWGDDDSGRPAARLWELRSSPDRPLQLVTSLQIPLDDYYFFDRFTFSSDCRVLTFSTQSLLVRYDAATGQQLSSIKTKDTILDVTDDGERFLKEIGDGRRFVFCGGKLHVPMYRFREPEPDSRRNWERTSVQIGELLVPDEIDSLQIAVCNSQTGLAQFNLTIPRARQNIVSPLELSPDGKHLVYEFWTRLYVWNVERQEQVFEVCPTFSWKELCRRHIREATFSDDSRRLIVYESNGIERHFDLASAAEVAMPANSQSIARRSYRWHRAESISDNGVILPAAPDASPPPGYARIVMDVSPDNQLIAIGDASGHVDLWRTDGRFVRRLPVRDQEIVAVGFSPDGRRLAACDRRRQMRIWNVATGTEIDRIDIPADHPDLYPEHLTFGPDGRQLLISRGDILAMWDLSAREWLWDHRGTLQEHYRSGDRRQRSPPVFSRDGERILCDDVTCWLSADTGEPLPDPKIARDGTRSGQEILAVSPDRNAFVKGEEAGFSVGDTKLDGMIRAFPESKRIGFDRARFSPDGRRLVTCDNHGHAHIWEVATGQLAFTLDYPDGDIANVFFTRDGRSLITSNFREVIVWDLQPERPIADKWVSLGHDAPEAEQARRALLADPKAAVDVLAERLSPASRLHRSLVSQWIEQLDDRDFRVRERAVANLTAIGRRVLPYLKEAKLNSDEGIARLSALVRSLEQGLTADERRHVRSIEVLGQINSPKAQDLIDLLAKGDPGAVLTEEAKKSATKAIAVPRSDVPRKPPAPKARPATTPVLERT